MDKLWVVTGSVSLFGMALCYWLGFSHGWSVGRRTARNLFRKRATEVLKERFTQQRGAKLAGRDFRPFGI